MQGRIRTRILREGGLELIPPGILLDSRSVFC
jgi:hypothetical protein